MQSYSPYFVTIIVLACIASYPVVSQRNFRHQAPQYCVTLQNHYGSCVPLSHCPQISNVFRIYNQRQAQQYVLQSQRSCGTRNINGNPVVCCSNPRIVKQTNSPQRRQKHRPVTLASPNHFFPNQRSINNRFLDEPATQVSPRHPKQAISCRGPDGREGACIPLIGCTELTDQLRIRHAETSFQNFLRASNRLCGGTATDVCCPSNKNSVKPVTSSPLIRNRNNVPRRLPTIEEGCGYTKKSFKKIVGGEVSEKGSWPWITLIGYDDDLSATPFKCGGTLVTARHVVTAAHCIRNDLVFVRLGEHDLTTDSEARHVDIKVVRSERHPNYNTKNGRSDIGILYLERNVEFTEFISPICLATTPGLQQKSYIKHSPFVAGWGKTMEGGVSANVLHELQISIFDNSVCRDRYQKIHREFTANQFDAAVICAGVLTGGKDTCQGDSGGPMMIPEPYQGSIRFYLIGVVAYGVGCARPEIPAVYSSTQYFIDWIRQKVANTR